jgi:hypothetical protein
MLPGNGMRIKSAIVELRIQLYVTHTAHFLTYWATSTSVGLMFIYSDRLPVDDTLVPKHVVV